MRNRTSVQYDPTPITDYDELASKLNVQKALEVYQSKKTSRGSHKNNLFSSQENIRLSKKAKTGKKTGHLYKRGDGPINYSWNPRYFILDGSTLLYYSEAGDKSARGMARLTDATVSSVDKFEDREYVFTITVPALNRTFYLSGETRDDTESWRDAIAEATSANFNTSPKYNLKSFTSVDEVDDFVLHKAADNGQERELNKKSIHSSPYSKKSSPHKGQTSIEASPTVKRSSAIPNRQYFKVKSRVMNELSVDEIPEAIKDLEADINELKNINKEKWQIKTFKNGVKVFDRGTISKIAAKFGMRKWGIIIVAIAFIFLQSGDLAIRVALLGFLACLYFLQRLQTTNKVNRTDIIGRVIIEEDALKIFQKVKKLKVRERWDLNIRNINKIDKREIARDKLSKPYEAEIILPKVSWPFFDGLKTIKCRCDRWTFILDEDTFVIVEISTLSEPLLRSRNSEFRMTEVMVAQRFSKMSGKCIITLLNRISTNFLPTFQLAKLRKIRVQNLSVIRDFLSEEFFYDQVHEIESDDEDRRSDYVEDQVGAEIKSSIIVPETPTGMQLRGIPGRKTFGSEQKDHREQNIISHHGHNREREISVMQPLEQMKRSKSGSPSKAVVLATKQGFDYENRQDLREEIANVDSLIRGNSSSKGKALEERKPGYKVVKSGGIECCNVDEIKSQEGIVVELMKTAGKTLMEGRNVVGISLPVRIFEPRSSIERMCDGWAFGPIYLNRAASTNDPIERLKNVVTFCISGLYMLCKQMKPFNPIIGETYQGYWPDGSSIFCEHTSHHPPITNFFVEDYQKRYTYYGFYELKGALKGNSVVAQQFGPNTVQFKDGTKIHFILPPFKLNGLLFGARTIEFQGSIVFTDEKNDLEAKLAMYENPSMFSRNLHPSDHFEGAITRLNGDKGREISKISGHWTSYIEFDGKRYWDLKMVDPISHVDTKIPLPSDARYREDLIYLAKRDMAKSQEHKIRLEKIQRADRKLRHDYKEKKEKEGK